MFEKLGPWIDNEVAANGDLRAKFLSGKAGMKDVFAAYLAEHPEDRGGFKPNIEGSLGTVPDTSPALTGGEELIQ